MAKLSEEFSSSYFQIPFSRQHLSCFRHILNLVTKAFLFRWDSNTFEADILTAKALNNEVAELDFWRKKGFVGKLHNIISYIQGSSQWQIAFTVCQMEQFNFEHQFQIIQDNSIHWNSTYNMIN